MVDVVARQEMGEGVLEGKDCDALGSAVDAMLVASILNIYMSIVEVMGRGCEEEEEPVLCYGGVSGGDVRLAPRAAQAQWAASGSHAERSFEE